MMPNDPHTISTIEQLDDYINSLSENQVVMVYQGGRPPMSQKMSQAYDLYNQAGQLVRNRNYEQAINFYGHILSLSPNFVAARYNMANLLKQLGNLDDALRHYIIAAQYNPRDPAIFIELGSIYSELGEKESEIASYFRALKVVAENDVAMRWKITKNIGQTYGEIEEFQKSLEWLQKALEIAKKYSNFSMTAESWNNEFIATYLELGNTYRYMGEYKKAEQMYLDGTKIGNSAKSSTPELRYHETIIWSLLARLYLELKQWSNAEHFAQKCIDRYPNEQSFQMYLKSAKNKF